ncbi:MAG: hypothetical protein QXT44_00445 [Candidatus Bathyarchaeia archaeon]
METKQLKAVSDALKELNKSYSDFLCSMKDTVQEVKNAKKLWHNGQKPWLIKLGLALLVFPDPTISDVLGAFLIAAGSVQEGIRRRALYVEDIPKTFKSMFKELQAMQESVNLYGKLG